ncbi:hypothetical protein QTJ16_006430 [Diplocarpon rosae]|uniref:Uncharacterized protein n=1 Tax=Diplocarpon rosae TaxID=946125 RepID=A0AAD9WAQ4_9HELO|nr:hypothetical protein QTJ16_006430 [Diplocarpon rosae]
MQELVSPDIPQMHVDLNTVSGSVATNSTRVLFRSPRSDDLVGLLRRNNMQEADNKGGNSISTCGVEQHGRQLDKVKWKTAASETDKMACHTKLSYGLSLERDTEWEDGWSKYDSGVCKMEEDSYNFSDADFDMSTPQNACKYGDKHALSAKFARWSDSPTCGREKGSCGSEMSYSNMDIGELMRGMEVDSDDTDDDIPDDMPKLLTFRRQKSSGARSSRIFSRHEKRRADPGLESPVNKRRHTGSVEGRVVSLARPLQGGQDMLFGSF